MEYEPAMTTRGTFYRQAVETGAKIFATAPMIDWSDRHYRVFARQLTKNALLFTEMIVADAILRGNRDRLLGFDAVERPVALQLGGNDPQGAPRPSCCRGPDGILALDAKPGGGRARRLP